ncbi:MAG: hypothetical protein ACTS73_05465 [Arsenophonus sp. NEOnobi-MAG3]
MKDDLLCLLVIICVAEPWRLEVRSSLRVNMLLKVRSKLDLSYQCPATE